MADHLALSGVSQTLRTLLRDRMRSPVPVTFAPPDVTPATFSGERVNLYLVEVSENAGLKNQEIPGQGHPAQYGHPPLSLELSYLLTTHVTSETADDADLTCQSLLADAMQTLHDFPILSDRLEITRPATGALGDPILHPSLRGEFERVKIVLQPAALEETTKLWSAIPSANFRRGVLYRVSTVQIESRSPRRLAQPVQTRHFFVTTIWRPEITEVYRSPLIPADLLGEVRVRIGEEITILGRNFLGERTWVQLGELEPIRVLADTGGRIRIALPDADYPIDPDHPATRPIPAPLRLQPGPLRVQVITEHQAESVHGGLDRGQTSLERRTYRSNLGLVLVAPQITGTAPAQGDRAALLTVTGVRLYRSDITTYVLVGDAAIEVRPPAAGDPWAAPTDTAVQVPLTALTEQLPPPLASGQSLAVGVQVNGSQNREVGFSFLWMP